MFFFNSGLIVSSPWKPLLTGLGTSIVSYMVCAYLHIYMYICIAQRISTFCPRNNTPKMVCNTDGGEKKRKKEKKRKENQARKRTKQSLESK